MAERDFDFILVSGHGAIAAAPDTAYINVGATAVAETAKQAMDEAHGICEPFIQKIGKRLGDRCRVVTSSLSTTAVHEKKRLGEDPVVEEVKAYKATQRLQVETKELHLTGEIIDLALSEGLNSFRGVSFALKNDREWRKQALEIAMENAREKAEVLAKAAGWEIEGIADITEGYANLHLGSILQLRGPWTVGAPSSDDAQAINVVSGATVRFRVRKA